MWRGAGMRWRGVGACCEARLRWAELAFASRLRWREPACVERPSEGRSRALRAGSGRGCSSCRPDGGWAGVWQICTDLMMVIASHQTLGSLLVDCDMTSTMPVPCSAGMGRCMFLGARKRADHLLRGCWLVEAWGVLLCPAVWRSTPACMASAESVQSSQVQCCVPVGIILF